MPLGPLDWTGPAFLTLYFTLFVAAALISVVAPRLLRPAGRDRPVNDPDELAWLAGGQGRAIDTAAVRLLTAGALEMRGRKRFGPGSAHAASPIAAETGWSDLARTLRAGADRAQARLRDAGLLVDEATRRRSRGWAAVPLLLLLVFGAAKWLIGFERDRDIGILTVALIAALILLVNRLATLDQRTEAGRAALARAWATHDRLRRGPRREELALAVGLYGTAVLAASELAAFHTLRSSRSGDGGGGDTSDGGCGGGGCGGCGGGD